MSTHTQINVEYQGRQVSVDAGLATTLQMVWKQGYETYLSCEDNFGKVWIKFDQKSFQALVQRAHDSYKISEVYYPNLNEFLEEKCVRESNWQDDGYANEDNDWVTGDTIFFYMSVRFDCSLLDTFCALFQQAHIRI